MNAAARQTETNAIQHPPSEVMQLGRAAVAALYDEVALYPKPGLVSFVDAGSHRDMDAQTFMRSLFALRRYFGRVACLGWQGAAFSELERCGIDAEADMLRATGGVNTHRGAIFTLGLLCAAAGSVLRSGERPDPQRLRAALRNRWGSALAARARRTPVLPGGAGRPSTWPARCVGGGGAGLSHPVRDGMAGIAVGACGWLGGSASAAQCTHAHHGCAG